MFLLHELLVSRGFFYMKKWFNIDILLAFFFFLLIIIISPLNHS